MSFKWAKKASLATPAALRGDASRPSPWLFRMPPECTTLLVVVEGGGFGCSLIRPDTLSWCVESADSMAMAESKPSIPFDADDKVVSLTLLGAPSQGMLKAARTLVRDPSTLPSVDDPGLLPAVERVFSELDEYDKQLCEDMAQEAPESPARLAFELALAQRISSTRIALDCGDLPKMPIEDEGEIPATPTAEPSD